MPSATFPPCFPPFTGGLWGVIEIPYHLIRLPLAATLSSPHGKTTRLVALHESKRLEFLDVTLRNNNHRQPLMRTAFTMSPASCPPLAGAKGVDWTSPSALNTPSLWIRISTFTLELIQQSLHVCHGLKMMRDIRIMHLPKFLVLPVHPLDPPPAGDNLLPYQG